MLPPSPISHGAVDRTYVLLVNVVVKYEFVVVPLQFFAHRSLLESTTKQHPDSKEHFCICFISAECKTVSAIEGEARLPISDAQKEDCTSRVAFALLIDNMLIPLSICHTIFCVLAKSEYTRK